MTFEKLRITGPDESLYVLGAPMHLFDGATPLGILDPVPVNRERTEVHIEHFTVSGIVNQQKREIAKLALLEMVMFVATTFGTVQVISLSLSREVEGFGDGTKLADARSAMLHDIGATHVMMTPKPDLIHSGHFVVTGVWEYNQANLDALEKMLEVERAAYGEREEAASQLRVPSRLQTWVRRLFPWSGADPVAPGEVKESRR